MTATSVGVIGALVCFSYLLWRKWYHYRGHPRKLQWARKLPARLVPRKLPPEVIKELEHLDDTVVVDECTNLFDSRKASFSSSTSSSSFSSLNPELKESCNWANIILQWIHSQSHPTANGGINLWDQWFWNECREFPHDVRRTPLGYILRDGRLLDYHFGTHFPAFSRVKFLKSTLRPGTFALGVDFTYDKGDVEMLLQWDATIFKDDNVSKIELYACIHRIKGRWLFVFDQHDILYYGFRRRGFESNFKGHLLINGWWQSPLINLIISKVLMPVAYRSKLVIPNLKGKWLQNRPEQPPYPWECPPDQPDLLYTWTPSSPFNTTTTTS